MNAIEELLASYSPTQLFLLLFLVGFALKAFFEMVDYFYKKLGEYFNTEHDKQTEDIKQTELLQSLELDMKEQVRQIKNISEVLNIMQERMQDQARNYIIDEHHKFVYELHKIDDRSLQSLERQYSFYSAAGGDTYVGGLMEEIRQLPKAILTKNGGIE